MASLSMSSSSSSMSTLASTSSSSSSRSPTRHGNYYFEDGNTILLVGNELFRLHRSILSRNSTLFRSMLSLPQAEGGTEGTVDTNPIVLGDYSPRDFELLLDMIYTSPTATMDKSLEQWKAILDIAHVLEVEWIHERAFAEMARFPLDPLDKVVIAQRFEDKRHLVREAYVALVRRETPLSIEEAQRIGLVDATRLSQAREMFRDLVVAQGPMPPSPLSIQQPQQPGPRGGVFRRAASAARHAPYIIPSSFSQQPQQMHSIAHGLASSLAPVLASTSGQNAITHAHAHLQLQQMQQQQHHQLLAQQQAAQQAAQHMQHQQQQFQQVQYVGGMPPPPPPPPSNSNVAGTVALGITHPGRLFMPYSVSPDAESQLQAMAEHCVDAIWGFCSHSQQGGSAGALPSPS